MYAAYAYLGLLLDYILITYHSTYHSTAIYVSIYDRESFNITVVQTSLYRYDYDMEMITTSIGREEREREHWR